jgi:hypothetical protein
MVSEGQHAKAAALSALHAGGIFSLGQAITQAAYPLVRTWL